MSSEKQLILIIITFIFVMGWQLWQDYKQKKHDVKLQRHLSKYFDRKEKRLSKYFDSKW